MVIKNFVLGVVALIILVAVLGRSDDSPTSDKAPATQLAVTETAAETEAREERPRLARVYAEIAAMDCAALQETFDRNMDRYEMRDPLERQQEGNPGTWEWAYAGAAQERIEERGC